MSYNASIKCTVDNCKHHSNGNNYCTLNKINIISHKNEPECPKCTDCSSFEKKL